MPNFLDMRYYGAMSALTLTLIFLLAYFCSVIFARLTGLSVIVGFLINGALLACLLPDLAGLGHSLELLTEIGIAFLLFEVGTHLPLKKVVSSWRQFFITGPAQVLSVSIILYAALRALNVPPLDAKIIAFALSLSSTAVVMQIFKEQGELGSPVSERAVSTLVFQDIAAVLGLSVLASLKGGTSDTSPALHIASLFGILFTVLFTSSLLVRPFFNLVVKIRSQEIITPAALLYVLTLAWAAHSLGLSYALGAFLGGVSIAGTRYSALVNSEIQPFRSLLLALFFVSVGLSIDSHFLIGNILLITSLTLGFMTLKFIALKSTSSREEPSIYAAGVLSQGSEFAFVLGLLASQSGMLSPEISQLLQAVVTLSLVIAPAFAALGCLLARSCALPQPSADTGSGDNTEVIITEFDEVARQLANALQKVGIQYRRHDRDLERIAYATSRGYKVFLSNTDRPLTLSKASLGHAKAIINLIEDELISANLVDELQRHAPNIPILAATRDLKLFDKLSSKGLTATFIKNRQTARLLFNELVSKLGESPNDINDRLKDWEWEEQEAVAI